jgi:hypothetical protein
MNTETLVFLLNLPDREEYEMDADMCECCYMKNKLDERELCEDCL